MILRSLLLSCCLLLVGTLFADAVHAQIWDRVRDRAEREVERRAERVTSRAVNAVLDELEDAVVCMATDETCIEEAEEEGKPVVITDEDGELVEVRDGEEEGAAEEAVAAAGVEAEVADDTSRPGEGAWANYDFVPGDQVLFMSNFEDYTIGRFPPNIEFQGGMMQLVDWEGQTLLESTDNSHFRIALGETVPERFTIEFDVYLDNNRTRDRIGVFFSEVGDPRRFSRHDFSYFYVGRQGAGVRGPTESMRDVTPYQNELTPVRIAVDGDYGTMYINEERVANIPVLDVERNGFIEFVHSASRENQPAYITNIRIAGGGLELYDRLMADGRVSTQGVYFDTGSASIRPESTGTLTEIGRMMDQHGDLRLRIEGHTDNVGDAQANMELSDQRAQSVMQYLVNQHGIAADRLEAVGMGEEAPVADNDTAEGRQNNRRVELVRLD